MSQLPSLIELSQVSKVYRASGSQAALSDLTLQIPAGQFTAVMGPSGSGKSTLLNLIAGLDRPTTGSIRVDDTPVSRLGEAALARYRRRDIGFVFQFFNLLNQLNVLDNVLLPAQLAGLQPRIAQSRARQLLERLGIANRAKTYPEQLSGGQRQRVALARALINQPKVLLADEPTGALDSHSGQAVMKLLCEVNQEGQTVVLVTHDAALAAAYASRIISLRDGRVEDDAQLQTRKSQSPSDLLHLHSEEAV
ncbi:MAG: ABC transporter ATP-binding protein [Ktedonobacterales bacterium]